MCFQNRHRLSGVGNCFCMYCWNSVFNSSACGWIHELHRSSCTKREERVIFFMNMDSFGCLTGTGFIAVAIMFLFQQLNQSPLNTFDELNLYSLNVNNIDSLEGMVQDACNFVHVCSGGPVLFVYSCDYLAFQKAQSV